MAYQYVRADQASEYAGDVILTSTNKVGIGTTSPTQKFEVNPDTDNSAKIGRAFIGYCGDSDYACFAHVDNATASKYALKQDSPGNTFINAPSTKAIYFQINQTYVMKIDTNGSVGIGTTSANAKLDVRGNAVFNEDGGDNDFRIEGDTDQYLLFGDASKDQISMGYDGSTGYQAKLQVKGNASNLPALAAISGQPTNPNSCQLGMSNKAIFGIASGTDVVAHLYHTSASGIALIVEQGSVGVGTTSPASGLHIGASAGGSNKGYITLEQLASEPGAPGTGKSILYMYNGHLYARVGTGAHVQLA